MSGPKLPVAVIGIGRMGQSHALNFAYAVPRAELVAVCDPRESALDRARKELPPNVQGFLDVKECFAKSGAKAVLIATETASHAPLAKLAMESGLHVLLEKPISIDVETSKEVVKVAEAHPELKTMVAFVRRFDESTRELKRMIDDGEMGEVHLLKSASNDPYDPSGFFVNFSGTSGGIFTDVGVHDIDVARWLLDVANGCPNPAKQVHRVFAIGQSVRHPELKEMGDADNGMGIVEFTNGTVFMCHMSRTQMNGHECWAELFGTEKKVVINGNPQLNKLEIRDKYGVRTESTATHYLRYKDAFVRELQDFTACVLDNKPLPVSLRDALEASKIATAFTLSYHKGVPVFFDDQGEVTLD
ncbi:hypothetical protein BCR39DRAFT_497705 [Naematelia encephala]|uniref:Myo-inositol 2-dehydrogenase n=1 Tax=Naematelia encephala TaxID=71784 RepID=A0A1Y2AYQ1_9TREE|nr:hypothetical protein BCR39DRAFT_497705 [Naematelia encephala]